MTWPALPVLAVEVWARRLAAAGFRVIYEPVAIVHGWGARER